MSLFTFAIILDPAPAAGFCSAVLNPPIIVTLPASYFVLAFTLVSALPEYKSTTIFNYCEIGPDLIEYIIDTTPEKIGKLAPGSHIPIINAGRIEDDADVVFLGAWNFSKEIMDKEHLFVKRGGKFLTHVPLVKFV